MVDRVKAYYFPFKCVKSDVSVECVLSFCDNATDSPNTGNNFDFTWDQNVIPIDENVIYPCKDSHAIEGDYDYKSDAPEQVLVLCGNDGKLQYPDPWQQCSEDITCADPGKVHDIIFVNLNRGGV